MENNLSEPQENKKSKKKLSTHTVTEDEEPKVVYKFPKCVLFIMVYEFGERFNYFGIKAILALYFNSNLGYSENMSTILYHAFLMMSYFTPLLGAMSADSWLGKFKTLAYVSIVYIAGSNILFFGSFYKNKIALTVLTMSGLTLMAIGVSGYRPVIDPFAGDQFHVPSQQEILEKFFSVLYMNKIVAGFFSTIIMPWLRSPPCLDLPSCYPLAFGTGNGLMLAGFVVFIVGKRFYRLMKPAGVNMLCEMIKVMNHALVVKRKSKGVKRKHWIDFADDKYSKKFLNDIKVVLRLVVLFSPAIIFWALFEQQGSRWTFQATRMDGRLGSFTIEPEQMQTLNHLLLIIFIPICQYALYPFMHKIRFLWTPLQKLCAGGFLAAAAFTTAGFVQMQIERFMPNLPSYEKAQLRIFNAVPFTVRISPYPNAVLRSLSYIENLDIPMNKEVEKGRIMISNNTEMKAATSETIKLTRGKIAQYLLYLNSKNKIRFTQLELEGQTMYDFITGYSKVKILYAVKDSIHVALKSKGREKVFHLTKSSHESKWVSTFYEGSYAVTVAENGLQYKLPSKVMLEPGGVYIILLGRNSLNYWHYKSFTIGNPVTVHILWQIPQYVAITIAEIMFAVTGMILAYTQSPKILTTAVSSYWIMTSSLGNLIVVCLTSFKMFETESHEMFLYAVLMSGVMIIFVVLAHRYQYVEYNEDDNPVTVRGYMLKGMRRISSVVKG